MADKVKEVAVEEFDRAKILTAEAIRSGAYFYPVKVSRSEIDVDSIQSKANCFFNFVFFCFHWSIHLTDSIQGIVYFLTNRTLWRPLASKLIPTLGLGLGITAFMFTFTYVPQAAVLTLVNGPLAFASTVLLVLSESSTIFNVLSKNFLVDEALLDTFDGTLVAKGLPTLVAHERQVGSTGDSVARLGKLAKKPFERFTPKAIIRYFLFLPLNMIPIVGTVLFVILQGRRFGPTAHARYFQLKQMNKPDRDDFVAKRQAAYTR